MPTPVAPQDPTIPGSDILWGTSRVDSSFPYVTFDSFAGSKSFITFSRRDEWFSFVVCRAAPSDAVVWIVY